MHIISYKKILQFIEKHPNSKGPLEGWYRIARKESFLSFQDIKNIFPSSDQVKRFVIFNIGGNNFRLIVFVNYKSKRIFIRHILTHADYDKEKWKEDEWFMNN